MIHLSPRERQILDLIADGLEGSEIAAALFISPHTVKYHRSQLFKKLGARTGGQAVHLGYQAGLLTAVDPGDLAVVRQAREMDCWLALVPMGGAR